MEHAHPSDYSACRCITVDANAAEPGSVLADFQGQRYSPLNLWENSHVNRGFDSQGNHCKYSSSLCSKCGCVIDTVPCFLRKLSAAIPRRQPSGPMYSASSYTQTSSAKYWEMKTFCITSAIKHSGVGNHYVPLILFCLCAYYASCGHCSYCDTGLFEVKHVH